MKLALLLFEVAWGELEQATLPATVTITVGVENGHGASAFYVEVGERDD